MLSPNFHCNNFKVAVLQNNTYFVHPGLDHPVVKGLCDSLASSGKSVRAKILFLEPIRVLGQDGSSLAVYLGFLSLWREKVQI